MKEFDLEKAKNGAPVCTRSGKPVRIVCFDAKQKDYPIVALVTEKEDDEDGELAYVYMIDGKYSKGQDKHNYDLMMVTTKHKRWINIYRDVEGELYSGCIYEREVNAKQEKDARIDDCLATLCFDWEE